jgi:hypothetical protein
MMAGLLALLGTLIMVTQVMTGIRTSNNFLYKPSERSQGAQEKAKFDAVLNQVDTRLGNEKWVNDPAYRGDFQGAVTAIGSNPTVLHIPPGIWPIFSDLTIPANITLQAPRGAILNIANGKTLTLNGPLEAGPHQVFSWAGTGAVVLSTNIPQVRPEWFYSDTGTYTDAFNKAFDSMVPGQVLALLPKPYTVGPLNCYKSIKITGGVGITNSTGVPIGTTLVAAGNQTHILRFGGANNTSANWTFNNQLENVNIDCVGHAMSDAALVLQYQEFSRFVQVTITSSHTSRAIRFKNVMDANFDIRILSMGIDGDCVMYVDEQEGGLYTNELHFGLGCQLENNRGSIMKFNPNSFSDNIVFDGVDFERNNGIAGNTINVPAFAITDVSRFVLTNCHFTNYNDIFQTELCTINGLEARPAAGIRITGNQFVNSNLQVTIGIDTFSVVVKDNQATYQSTLSLSNYSKYGSVIFEQLFAADSTTRNKLLFQNHRTPFIPIADIGYPTVNKFIKDDSSESLGQTGQLYQTVLSGAGDSIAQIPLKQFANISGDLQVWVRAKSASGSGTLGIGLDGNAYHYYNSALWGEQGVQTFGTTMEWRKWIIPRHILSDPLYYVGNMMMGAGEQTDTLTVDGIQLVILETSSQSVAYAGTVTPNFELGSNLKIGTLTGEITIANPFKGVSPGQRITIDMTCDGTGRAITWGDAYKCAKTSMTANKRAVIEFIYDGTNYVQVGTVQELQAKSRG